MGRRGKPCSICQSDARAQIELALVAGLSRREIGTRYAVSPHAVWRHGQQHLAASQRAAIALAVAPSEVDLEQLSRSESEGLLAHLVAQRARLAVYAQSCADAGDFAAAVRAERAITQALDLTSRLLGRIVARHEHVHAHLTLTPSYLRLRARLVEVLRPHPQIAVEVAAALRELEHDDAQQITDAGKPVAIEHTP